MYQDEKITAYENTAPYEASSSASPTVRAAFFPQVMFYFGLAILTSAAGTFVGFQYLIPVFLANPSLMWILFAVELILIFTSRAWSARRPINYLLFALFAFITGVTIVPLLASIIMEFGGPSLIIKAFLATTFMFSGTALFGWVTKKDLSGLRGFLWVALIGMIIISIMGIFIPWGNNFEIVFSGFGVLLFGAYTMYDFQRLKMFPQDRAMDAALMLYLNIFNMFLFILRLLSGVSRD